MPEEMREVVCGLIRDGYKKHTPYGQAAGQRNMAKFLKESMDETYGGAWHVIVGTEFGSYVSHEMGSLMYATIGPINVFLYQHG